jgi:hypothetical protein
MVSREYLDGNGQTHAGVRYYISSLPTRRARTIARAVRSHWSIENQVHWAMDVTFGEDTNRTREKNAQANLGMLRRTALSLLKNAVGLSGSINCKRKQAAGTIASWKMSCSGVRLSKVTCVDPGAFPY